MITTGLQASLQGDGVIIHIGKCDIKFGISDRNERFEPWVEEYKR